MNALRNPAEPRSKRTPSKRGLRENIQGTLIQKKITQILKLKMVSSQE